MRRVLCRCALLAALYAVHLLLLTALAAFPARVEARPYRYGLTGGESVTAAELERYSGVLACAKEAQWGDEDILLTNSAYGDLAEFTLTAGSYFTERAAELGLNVAVISEETAFDRFGTLDVVGASMDVGGVDYTVCGVYQLPEPWRTLSSDGREDICLPLNSGYDQLYGEDLAMKHILLPAVGEGGTFLAEDVRRDLREVSARIDNYKVTDLSHVLRSAEQPLVLSLTFLALVLSAAMARRGLRSVRARPGWGGALQLLAAALLLTAAVWLVRYELFLPAWLLPADSLLDFGYYKDLIAGFLTGKNALYAYRPSRYELIQQFALTASAVLALLEAAAGLALGGALRKEEH